MSATPPAEERPALTTPPAHAPATAAWHRPAARMAALGLAVVLGLAAWQWHTADRLEASRQELSRRLAEADAAQREAQGQAKQQREALEALQAKVGAVDARLAEMQSQQLALETMYQELSRVRDDRLLAETEQDVALAAQQLQLAGNVQAALISLQGAEARLAKNAQPQFLPLRKLLIRDIERLKSLPGADVPGITLKLDALLDAVPSLPLAFEHRPVEKGQGKQAAAAANRPAESDEKPTFGRMLMAWLDELWHEVRQLVRLERLDRPDPGLLAPRETYFLRENLRLRLLAARLSLLARDGRGFKADLRQADEWVERYFDTRAPAVVEVRALLKSLGHLDVMRETADLNETLAALRNLKLTRDRGERGAPR